jgi:gas vesicle protein
MARWNEQDSSNSMFLLGAIAGALVGAGVALLMAPKTGAQVRRELNSGFNTVKDAAARRYRDVADKATQMYDEKVSRSTTTAADRFNGGATSSDSFTATPGTSGYQS